MKRGRNQRRRQGVNPNRALDSNGPDVRIRGTANQIYDKYQALARDASSSGDRIKAESYLQHAEHYFRLIRSTQQANQQQHAAPQESDSDQPTVGDDDQLSSTAEGERENGRARDSRRGEGRRGGAQRRNGAAPEARNEAGDDAEATAMADEAKPAQISQNEAAGEEEEKKPRRRRTTRKKTVKKADEEDAEKAEEEQPATAAAAE